MGGETYSTEDRKPLENPADRTRRIRLWLHRWVDATVDRLIHPGYAGTAELGLSSKDGRLFEPKTSLSRLGCFDLDSNK